MGKKIKAHIECNSSGWYSVYVNEDFPFGFFGEGKTAEEAKEDFMNMFNEMAQSYKEKTGESVSAVFEFVYDISAILQECKNYVSFAYLAKVTGINKGMLSQYACGIRKPKPAQRERIINGIHTIGNQCLAIK